MKVCTLNEHYGPTPTKGLFRCLVYHTVAAVRVADRLPTIRVAAVTCFAESPLSVDLSVDVLVRLSLWRPPVWDTYPDGGGLETLALPLVRCWVTLARPVSVSLTLRMLRAVSEFTMWMYDTSGVVDVRLLSPTNVEYWANQVNADRSGTWRRDKRWLLRRVGRAAHPDGWVVAPVGEPNREEVLVRVGRAGGNELVEQGERVAARGLDRISSHIKVGGAGELWSVDRVIEAKVGRDYCDQPTDGSVAERDPLTARASPSGLRERGELGFA